MWTIKKGKEATYQALMRIFYDRKNRRMVEILIELLDTQVSG